MEASGSCLARIRGALTSPVVSVTRTRGGALPCVKNLPGSQLWFLLFNYQWMQSCLGRPLGRTETHLKQVWIRSDKLPLQKESSGSWHGEKVSWRAFSSCHLKDSQFFAAQDVRSARLLYPPPFSFILIFLIGLLLIWKLCCSELIIDLITELR